MTDANGGQSLANSDADARAADWLARLRADRVTGADWAQFEQWCQADPSHRPAYARVSATWRRLGACGDDPAVVRLRMAALALAAPPPRRWWARTPAALATAAAAVLTIAGVGWQLAAGPSDGPAAPRSALVATAPPPAPPPAMVPAPSPAAQPLATSRYSTRIGERAAFLLPDGSRLELNTGSLVEVRFSPGRRDLTLLRGEALFRVARDAARPFAVTVAGERVVALGTVFSVRRDDGRMLVTLLEGRVRVERGAPGNAGAAAQLSAGEQLASLTGRPFEISKANIAAATAWQSGRLVFDNQPLSAVVAEINRYASPKLVIGDPELATLPISASLRIGSTDGFAAALAAGFDVAVEPGPGGALRLVQRSGGNGAGSGPN